MVSPSLIEGYDNVAARCGLPPFKVGVDGRGGFCADNWLMKKREHGGAIFPRLPVYVPNLDRDIAYRWKHTRSALIELMKGVDGKLVAPLTRIKGVLGTDIKSILSLITLKSARILGLYNKKQRRIWKPGPLGCLLSHLLLLREAASTPHSAAIIFEDDVTKGALIAYCVHFSGIWSNGEITSDKRTLSFTASVASLARVLR